MGLCFVCTCQYMSSVNGCEWFPKSVVRGSSPGSLVERHNGCLQKCLLLYIVRAIWQEMYDIQPLTTL